MPPDTDTYLLDRTGQILAGRYRVRELLGVGSMGSVWIAEQIALHREVVVKFHEAGFQGMGSDRALARFHREVRSLASVRHRNVAELYESGTGAKGEPYIIMEKLVGETLAARMRHREGLDVGWVCEVAIAIGWGLDAVHQAGVVHRDVKPENLFLHRAEGELVPKLLDFGLAREDEAHAAESTRHSRAKGASITGRRSALGTPGYMAPEQALAADDLDGRVDQYALAVCVYEMLAGRLPARGASGRELLHWTVNEEPVPLQKHRPDLDAELAGVVMRALARDRDERFALTRDLCAALDRVRERLPPPSPPSEPSPSLPAVRPPPPPAKER